MNDIFEVIHQRRSVRSYGDEPVSEESLAKIIEAGQAAPSGMNLQSWRFVVVTDPALRRKLRDLCLPGYRKWSQNATAEVRARRAALDKTTDDPIYYNAPAVIFVIGRGAIASLDCPMVCQNMMLAARALGLGSCWVHMGQMAFDDPQARKLFDLTDDEKVYGPIVLGTPKGDFPEKPFKKLPQVRRFKPQ